MIKRIVKLTFAETRVADFLQLFEATKDRIRSFPGCGHLELLRHASEPNVFFTLSHWAAEADLEAYRNSELFQTTWSRTKALFAAKPEAWSLEVVSQTGSAQ